MHSGFILFLWLLAVAGVHLLPPPALAFVVALALMLALTLARARSLRLLRRVRVLMIAIAVLFAWFTPGEAVFAGWPQLGPTREGVTLALLHAARLAAVVCAVALLLERLPVARLVGGLYALARPFTVLGLPAERLALRLLLVLRFVDETPRAGAGQARVKFAAGDWKHWLQDDDGGAADLQPVQLVRERFGAADRLCAVLLVAALLIWGWR